MSDYWIAHAIYKVRTQRAKYWLVGLSVLVNLGMLGYFKYTNFLIEIANNLFGQEGSSTSRTSSCRSVFRSSYSSR